MDLSFKPKLTKDLILSQYTEEQLMAFYLRVPIKKGLFRSPLRNDKMPTCSLYRNKSNNLIFHDFATGQHLNIFGVVQTLYNCNYQEALEIIANDFHIVDSNIPRNKGKIIDKSIKIEGKTISKIQVTIKDFTSSELKWWNGFGITPEILKHFDVYSCEYVFLDDQIIAQYQQHCPIYGYYGGKMQENGQKYELWKCYFPHRKSYRFIGNYPAKKLQGYNKLPKNGNVCVITKSLKDVMCLYSLGIPACAPNSETVIPAKTIIDDLKSRFKRVICLWDSDYTGITFLNKFKKQYPELIYTWVPRKYEAKDISDFYKKYKKADTISLIKDFSNKLLTKVK